MMTLIMQIFFMLGGLTTFMVGMKMMGSNLEKAAGSSMRKLMTKASANRFVGVGTGAVVTAIVNSSSATTVMIVGFVNVGLLTLVQATSIIMGANIGTTISAFIMALSGAEGFSMAAVFSLLAFVGLIIQMVGKSDKIKRIGSILIGVGFIFIGLNFMSSAVNKIVNDDQLGPQIRNIFIMLGNGQETLSVGVAILLFLVGVLFTALMQASAALTGILIALASQGLITINMAIFITLGSNIGTCATSLISSFGTNINARRTAVIHLLFNVIGCLMFFIPLLIWEDKMVWAITRLTDDPKWQIAIFHMFFNVMTTLILIWFIKPLTKLACVIVPESRSKKKKQKEPDMLDVRFLETPPIAVAQVRRALLSMADMSYTNFKRSVKALLNSDLSEKDAFAETEKKINAMNKEVTAYCIKLNAKDLSMVDESKVGSFYHVTSDIERIGDYAENIVEFTEAQSENLTNFSEEARAELQDMEARIDKLYRLVVQAFEHQDLTLMPEIDEAEEAIDAKQREMEEAHIRRMHEGVCNVEIGAIYLQIAGTLERIGDHITNIANSVKTYKELPKHP